MGRFIRRFQLDAGVLCNATGLWVGGRPLLEKKTAPNAGSAWQPRSPCEIDRALSDAYGLPIDARVKMSGLRATARSLNAGDVAAAQVAALHLQLPEPPAVQKGPPPSAHEITNLASQLHAVGLLKLNWNPDLHPRWPAGTPDSAGGQFAPSGAGGASDGPRSGLDQTLDIPMEEPFPLFRPLLAPPPPLPYPPGEVLPPPVIPRNPFPDNPKCEGEWEEALRYCFDLDRRGKLNGLPPYRGHGNLEQCIRGRVSEECGGNPVV